MNLQEYDFDFRPDSYWEHDNALAAILCNIKGANRREMIEDIVTGKIADMTDDEAIRAALSEVDPGLLEDSLSDEDRIALGHIHPSFMGGEYLPGYLPGEVEIARITLESTTQDVTSIRARRRARGICYRVIDEYDSGFYIMQQSSKLPLTLGGLVRMINTMEDDNATVEGHGYVETIWSFQEPDEVPDFVTVSSDFYPELIRYFGEKEDLWLQGRMTWYDGGGAPLWLDGDEYSEVHAPGSSEFESLKQRVKRAENVEDLRKILADIKIATAGVWRAFAEGTRHIELVMFSRILRDPVSREGLFQNPELDDDDWARLTFWTLNYSYWGSAFGSTDLFKSFRHELERLGMLEKYQPLAEEEYPELGRIQENEDYNKRKRYASYRYIMSQRSETKK